MSAQAEITKGPVIYARVLAILLVLTGITVVAAGVNFGSAFLNVVIALTIASAKASLVALYFMHLRHDRPMNAVIFLTGLAMLAIFLMFCFLDTLSRDWFQPTATVQALERAAWISSRIRSAS